MAQSTSSSRRSQTAKLLKISRDPGSALHQARRKKNISVSEAAKRLKTTTEVVRSVEKWQIKGILEPVFLRDLVHRFCKLVNLESDLILEDLPSSEVNIRPTPQAKTTKRGTLFIGSILSRALSALVIIAAVSYLAWLALFSVQKPSITSLNIENGQRFNTSSVELTGSVEHTRSITVNGAPAKINQDNSFEAQLILNRDSNAVRIQAVNSRGEVTQRQLTVYRDHQQ